MKFFLKTHLIVFFAVALLCPGMVLAAGNSPVLGQPAAERGSQQENPIDYTGDKISYDQAKNILRGEGHVIITHKNMSLKADRVIAYLETSDVYADGNVVFTSGNQVFTGEKVHFNFKTRLGDFINGSGFVDPWYGKGKLIRKAGPNEYQITEGYITSCDYQEPHYKIKARKIFIYPKDRLIARDVILSIGKFDVLWSPMFARSLKDERQRFTFIPGYNRKFGAFLLAGYNFWLDPYLNGTIHADTYTKRGFGTGVSFDYHVGSTATQFPMQGQFKSYAIKDRDFRPSQAQGAQPGDVRYRVEMKHEQQIFSDTRALMEVHALSDPDIVNDFFRDQFEQEIQPRSYLDIAKTTPNYRLDIIAQKRINKIFTELERLPELQFQTRTLPVGNTGLYYTNTNLAGYYNFVPLNENDYDSIRADTLHEISYPTRLFRWLNLEPRFAFRETYYAKGVNDNNLFRTVITPSIDVFTKISKLYPDVHSNFWQVDQLRHLIEPRVTYTYTPTPNRTPQDLLQFDGVDKLDTQNFFRFGLRNKLQTRRREQTVDIVDVEFFTQYHPSSDAPATDRFGNTHIFGPISADSRFRILDWFAVDLRGSYDQYNSELSSLLADVALINGDQWNISLRQRQQAGQSNLSAAEILYRFSPDWIGKAFWRYDFHLHSLEEQEYTLLRDLHCWEVALTFRQRKLASDISLFVIFRLKDYPGVPIKFGN